MTDDDSGMVFSPAIHSRGKERYHPAKYKGGRNMKEEKYWEKTFENKTRSEFTSLRWMCGDGDYATVEIDNPIDGSRDDKMLWISCISGMGFSKIELHSFDLPRNAKMDLSWDGKSDWIEHCLKIADKICALFCDDYPLKKVGKKWVAKEAKK